MHDLLNDPDIREKLSTWDGVYKPFNPNSILRLDFETYSEAGYDWNGDKWVSPRGGTKNGILLVGAWAYSEHPSTEVLYCSYAFDDEPVQHWIPGAPAPQRLLAHIAAGGVVEAHNWFFEYAVWTNVCVPKLGWPPVTPEQFDCTMAKGQAWGLPGKLEKMAEVLKTQHQKDMAGNTVMKKLTKPRNPTKKDASLRYTPESAPDDFQKMYSYGDDDVLTQQDCLSSTVR